MIYSRLLDCMKIRPISPEYKIDIKFNNKIPIAQMILLIHYNETREETISLLKIAKLI